MVEGEQYLMPKETKLPDLKYVYKSDIVDSNVFYDFRETFTKKLTKVVNQLVNEQIKAQLEKATFWFNTYPATKEATAEVYIFEDWDTQKVKVPITEIVEAFISTNDPEDYKILRDELKKAVALLDLALEEDRQLLGIESPKDNNV
jgi:hypothetical protein